MPLDQCTVCVNVSGLQNDIMRAIDSLRNDLNKHKLYISVGVGCSLIQARLAQHLASYNGVKAFSDVRQCVIETKALPVAALTDDWQVLSKLAESNIQTISQIRLIEPDILAAVVG